MRRLLFLIVAAACAAAATPAYPDASATATHRYHDVHGSRLNVETFGNGAPIVFLHGGLGSFDTNFANQRDYFAADELKRRSQWTPQQVDDKAREIGTKVPPDFRIDDKKVSIEETVEIYRNLAQGPLIILPATGHATMTQRPEPTNPVMREFLERPDTQSAVR